MSRNEFQLKPSVTATLLNLLCEKKQKIYHTPHDSRHTQFQLDRGMIFTHTQSPLPAAPLCPGRHVHSRCSPPPARRSNCPSNHSAALRPFASSPKVLLYIYFAFFFFFLLETRFFSYLWNRGSNILVLVHRIKSFKIFLQTSIPYLWLRKDISRSICNFLD